MLGDKHANFLYEKHFYEIPVPLQCIPVPLQCITCDISANDFNHHFTNIGKTMNSKFQNFNDNFFWTGPKSIHSFRFKRMSSADIVTYLGSLPRRSNNDILCMDLVLLMESAPYISIALANVINKSLESGVFEQDWKSARVTPIYKDDGDINDENIYRPISVIGHIAKMIESLVSYQIVDFWKNIGLLQWTILLM